MTEAIPDDVMKAANAILDAEGHAGAHFLDLTYEETADLIARAIIAERERCALIADANAHADCEVAEQIAAAIRSGQ